MAQEPAGRAPSEVEIGPDDLPLHCPTPAMALWSTHPRVFLPVGETGEARCPYCGTRFRLRGGPPPGGAH